MTQHTPITCTSVDRSPDHRYNAPMTNNLRSLDDISVAYMNDDSWVWKDDMIVFPREDDFYAAEEDRRAELLHQLATEAHEMIWGSSDEDHPICGEFPHDSIVAPRGWDKVG